MADQPKVVIIAGPNGSGKSTCAPDLLRDYCRVIADGTGTEASATDAELWRELTEKYK